MAFQRGVFWGVVPYAPAAPFSVKLLQRYEDVETISELHRKFQEYAGELPFSVEAKMRPVLALSEPSVELRELPVLRLVNITRRVRNRQLTDEEADQIRDGDHPRLFQLAREVVARISNGDTYAVLVENPGTLHVTALVPRPIGEVSEPDFAQICARLVGNLGLDLSALTDG